MFAPLFPVLGICAVSFNVFLTGLYFIFEGFSRNMLSVFIRFYGKMVMIFVPMSALVAPLEIFPDWSNSLKAGYTLFTLTILIGAAILISKWTSPEGNRISRQLKREETSQITQTGEN